MTRALVGSGAVLILLGALYVDHLHRDAHLGATARLVETGVDPDGYWYARVEFTNAGTLPWYIVLPSRLAVLGDPDFSLEVGSTLPYYQVPNRFEVVLEATDEGVVPVRVDGVGLQLGVVSAMPWYVGERQLKSWSHELRP